MKVLIIAIILLLGFPSYSFSTVFEEIVLKGKCEQVILRSLSLPIRAWVDGDILFIESNNPIADVTIRVIDPEGKVEQRTVSFTDSQVEMIKISESLQGMYSITMTTPRGTDIYGTFQME